MLNKVCQARTEAQQRTKDEVTTSSHTIGKPNVICSQSVHFSLSNRIRPNLNPYALKVAIQDKLKLKSKPLAVLVKLVLDSVGLTHLGRRTFLYRLLLNSYNRLIEPSHTTFREMYLAIEEYEKQLGQAGRNMCGKVE